MTWQMDGWRDGWEGGRGGDAFLSSFFPKLNCPICQLEGQLAQAPAMLISSAGGMNVIRAAGQITR
ncbi:UNVERIFIED_CONTAM: hypothetical protein FKN15_058131 [Acipenser sinensis]